MSSVIENQVSNTAKYYNYTGYAAGLLTLVPIGAIAIKAIIAAVAGTALTLTLLSPGGILLLAGVTVFLVATAIYAAKSSKEGNFSWKLVAWQIAKMALSPLIPILLFFTFASGYPGPAGIDFVSPAVDIAGSIGSSEENSPSNEKKNVLLTQSKTSYILGGVTVAAAAAAVIASVGLYPYI